jgi:hypothetical protein
LLNRKQGGEEESEEDMVQARRPRKLVDMPAFVDSGDEGRNENQNNYNIYGIEEKKDLNKKQNVNLGSLGKEGKEYSAGQYCGLAGDLKRSAKLA